MKILQKFWCLTALLATGTFFLAGYYDARVSANNTPQTLPFSQNWSNTGLITANDDWAAVPGIIGYLGDIAATTTTNVDPRTLLLDYSSVSAVDVIANQTNPDTLTNGGVAEFEITNPSVALNGSGTADAPHIIVHLNTTGQSGIQFACNVRDLDASADDSVQQVDVQYRVGGTGNYASVSGGYIADATTGGSATQVTPISVTLPADANNQTLVQIRVMTTNAGGNDEWIGIDDINITAGPAVSADAPNDVNGDGRSDYTVARNVGGGASGQVRWYTNTSGTAEPTVAKDWGLASDFLLMEDFDGDNKDDITVWRPGAALQATFYILESAGNTARVDTFGQLGDNPTVIGDYDGDGKADVAVYRPGATGGATSTWFYRGSLTPANVNYVPWGRNGDFPAPGDYDGDGKFDFVIQRNDGGQGVFWTMLATGTVAPIIVFGQPTDVIVPGDYDGDGKYDIATVRGVSGNIQWQYLSSVNSSINYFTFGLSATDFPAQGDYDGDGKVEPAIWRPNADPTMNFYISLNSSNGAVTFFELGQNGDYPTNNWNTH